MTLEGLSDLALHFVATHPRDAARVLGRLPPDEVSPFLDSCPPGVAADVARHLTAQELVSCLRQLHPERAATLLQAMPRDQVATGLRRLEEEERRKITDLLPADKRRALEPLLRYPEGSAGALMETVVLTVSPLPTVTAALEAIDHHRRHLRYYIYVVDDDERLVGVTDLRTLMTAEPGLTVESIMHRQVHRISARAGEDAILRHHGWEEVHALPVVDERNTLVGVLRYETVQQLARGERPPTIGETPVAALGELFWVGSQRVLGEFLDIMKRGPA